MALNSTFPSNTTLDSHLFHCSISTVGTIIGTAFNVTRAILLLPLSVLVLYLGYQRWRQQRSFATTSHSDIFTYHMAAMDLIWGLGLGISYSSFFTDLPEMMLVAFCLSSVTFYGETFFHLLTCVERYLAVVHPITYRGLRKARGVRIRNVSIGSAWLLSLILMGIASLNYPDLLFMPFFVLLVFSSVAVSFFSLSVLCVLIRPGPGEGGKDKKRVDQSKQKAFFTIVAITGVLWLWFAGFIVSVALGRSTLLSPSVTCAMQTSSFWFSLPSSLVLPLLYLQRAGKLPCSCYNSG